MVERRFPILGGQVPPMVGREKAIQRILAALTKPAPDHLQIVGPRFSGKTVLLHEVSRRLQSAGKPYTGIMRWDLGHQTPASDEAFMQRLARELAATLSGTHKDYAEHLKAANGTFQEIAEVLDALKDDGKILAILDGFDKPLSNGNLTRNLWDQLRELAAKPSLRMVTASRSTLRDLIRNPEAQTSDFWNIFDPTPVRIGCFDDLDIDAILAGLPGLRLSPGARTELLNWTNAHPVLLLEVLNVLEWKSSAEASAEQVVAACGKAYPALRDAIESMWNDCSLSSRDLLLRVREAGSLARGSGIPQADVEALVERGFISLSGSKLERANRLLSRFVDEHPHGSYEIARLFGGAESYERNLKEVLSHRVQQIQNLDPTLKRYLERAAGDLPQHPDVFLTNVRGIVDHVFGLVFNMEMGERKIPSAWMSIWKRNGESGIDDWETTFPQGVQRLRLVHLMTGSMKSTRCAKHLTKTTYALLQAANSFGDFGQHQEGAPLTAGVGYAAWQVCIELAASVSRDLAMKSAR